mgnify:FL=1
MEINNGLLHDCLLDKLLNFVPTPLPVMLAHMDPSVVLLHLPKTGGHLILLLHERTIWVSCGLLFVGFLLMFIKEELEEHPRILEEEQEIRKNIQNIREETKKVENIIKEDLKK